MAEKRNTQFLGKITDLAAQCLMRTAALFSSRFFLQASEEKNPTVLLWSFKCKQKCTMVLQCTRHMAVTSNPGFRGHCEGLCPNKGALSSRPSSSGRCWKASTRVLEPDATMTLSPIDKLLPEITRRKAGDHRNIYSPSSALSVTSILSSITSIMAQRPLSD